MISLKNKTIIITGAGKGIGAACVRLMLASGAQVIAASRSLDDLRQLQSDAGDLGHQLTVFSRDVSQEDQVQDLFRQVRDHFSSLDGLVQCAAIFHRAMISQMSWHDWQRVLEINLTGSFLCLKAALACMSPNGSIVHIGSLSGVPGVEKFKGFAAYNVSKYGVIGLTEIGAVEGREKNIRVNCVSPGAVDTAMLKQAAPQLPPAMTALEVAQVVRFLLADQSRAINGENIVLQGHPGGPLRKEYQP